MISRSRHDVSHAVGLKMQQCNKIVSVLHIPRHGQSAHAFMCYIAIYESLTLHTYIYIYSRIENPEFVAAVA